MERIPNCALRKERQIAFKFKCLHFLPIPKTTSALLMLYKKWLYYSFVLCSTYVQRLKYFSSLVFTCIIKTFVLMFINHEKNLVTFLIEINDQIILIFEIILKFCISGIFKMNE